MGDKPPLDRVLFAKVCEMMTSSHEGERAAATERANAMLARSGLSWTEALKPQPVVSVPRSPGFSEDWFEQAMRRRTARNYTAPKPPPKHKGWAPDDFEYADLAKEMEQHECFEELEEKHQEFIIEMSVHTGRPYTEKQRGYLDGLSKKLNWKLKARQGAY